MIVMEINYVLCNICFILLGFICTTTFKFLFTPKLLKMEENLIDLVPHGQSLRSLLVFRLWNPFGTIQITYFNNLKLLDM